MNLRVIGLTAVVVFTALLPLAASAGSPDGPPPGPVPGPVSGSADAGADAKADGKAEADATLGDMPVADPEGDGVAGGTASRAAELCGPEVASAQGVEAQTCVLTTGHTTWARTYYRNTTGRELRSVLSLMGPGGRALQTDCAVAADDEPAVCETPRGRAGSAARYSAVAEFAAAAPGGGAGDDRRAEPLLLRSGSDTGSANSPE